MSRQIYVRANSKAEINRRMQAGTVFIGHIYTPFDVQAIASTNWMDGDVIKVYSKMIGGTPYAKSYGTVVRKDASAPKLK